jgi:DNA-binding NarL/FixJ family response regulator
MSDIASISIWLIEDNKVYREAAAQALRKDAAISRVIAYESWEVARGDLKRTPKQPDVILLDIGLPGTDGLTALPQIRELSPQTRVLVLTVFEDDDKIFKAICAGASGYLLKSTPTSRIQEAIHQAVAGGSPMTPSVAARVLDLFAKNHKIRFTEQDDLLSERERAVLALMAEGMVKKEISDKLGISEHTVTTYLRRVYEKLHVNTNTAAVATAVRRGLV